MGLVSSFYITAFASTLFAAVSARPLPRATSTDSLVNVAYYGQGPDQPLLGTFCADSSLDIIPIAFVNGLSSGNGGYPAMNFGNVCGANEYYYDGSTQTKSFTKCANFVSQIPVCKAAGKKIFISIGGAVADIQLSSKEEAVAFGNQLWDIFGPYNESYTGPRPFGTEAVDGFDFDLESGDGSYWVDVASTLRSKFSKGEYYLSAAPQCLTSDISTPMIQGVYFDYVWVQYFNTPQCSARNFFDQGESRSGIGFDTWAAVLEQSANPDVPLLIGLPGSSAAVPSYPDNVLSVSEVTELIDTFACSGSRFGGIMLWDATYALNNNDYASSVKSALNSVSCSSSSTSSTTVTATSTSTATATSTSSVRSTSTSATSTESSTTTSSSVTTSSVTTSTVSTTSSADSSSTQVSSSTTATITTSTSPSTTTTATSTTPHWTNTTSSTTTDDTSSTPIASSTSTENPASTVTTPISPSPTAPDGGSGQWGNWGGWSNGAPAHFRAALAAHFEASPSETHAPFWAFKDVLNES